MVNETWRESKEEKKSGGRTRVISSLDAKAIDEVGVGMDHGTIMMIIAMQKKPSAKTKKPKHRSNRGRAPADADQYEEQLGCELRRLGHDRRDEWNSMAVEEKCQTIETLLLESAALNRTMATQCRIEENHSSFQLLIDTRKAARIIGSRVQVKNLSKQLGREIRGVDRARKRNPDMHHT